MVKSGVVLYDENHPVDWRVDCRDSITKLALITKQRPNLQPTLLIDVYAQAKDDSNVTWLRLLDGAYSNVFHAFCVNMIEETRDCFSDEAAIDRVEYLYRRWRRMFTSPRSMDKRLIKGLIAELVFLRDWMFPRYGPSRSLKSWMNVKLGKQDFAIDETWYEVKSIDVGKHDFTISSLEQLDKDDAGLLVLVFLQETSPESSSAVTLVTLYNEILAAFAKESDRQTFEEIMALFGYKEDEVCNSHVFEVNCIRTFKVEGEDFPRLRASRLGIPGILDATYKVSLESISKFEVRQ